MHSNQSHHLKTPQQLNVARCTLTHTNKNMSNNRTTTSAKCIPSDECQCSTITTSTNITITTTNTNDTIPSLTSVHSTNTNNANLNKIHKPLQLLSSVPIPCIPSVDLSSASVDMETSVVLFSSSPKPDCITFVKGRQRQLGLPNSTESSVQCITSCLVTGPVDGVDDSAAALTPYNGMHAVLSKSETNLFVNAGNAKTNVASSPKGSGSNKLAIFNVVSLNNLHESDGEAFGSGKPMNDLSKNQTLNNISNDEIHLQLNKRSGCEMLSKDI